MKTLKMLLIALLSFSLVVGMTACSEKEDSPTSIDDNDGTNDDGTNDDTNDDTTDDTTDDTVDDTNVDTISKISLGGFVSFNVKNATGLIATEESATTQTASIRRTVRSDGKMVPVFEFYDKERFEALKKSRADDEKTTNLFSIDADGIASPAIESSRYDVKVQYSLLSRDGDYIYIAMDPGFDEWGNLSWSSEAEGTRQLIGESNCSVFKVSLADNNFTCLDPGYLAFPVTEDFRKVLSDSSSKPLQMDEEGNIYYLTAPFTRQSQCWNEWDADTQQNVQKCYYYFDYDWSDNKILRKVSPDGVATNLTPDTNQITNFKVIPDGSIVYMYYDTATGGGGLKLYSDDSTNTLTDTWYGDTFFTTDDMGTVIYGSSNYGWGDNGIQFSQKHPTIAGAKKTQTLSTKLFTTRSNSPTPNRIIVADDGAIYGLFTEDMSYWDNTNNTWVANLALNVFRILPYKASPVASIKLNQSNWWDAMNGIDFQISKGYLYFVETETHPQDYYSPRQVIKIVRTLDGETTTLLDSKETVDGDLAWNDRYEIFNWKLSGDIIYFSAFDNANSKVVTGEIDAKKVKQGALSSEYLVIKEAASALGSMASIKDMEILTPKAPAVDTGSDPVITRYYTDPENLYSASLDFSKYMDNKSVNERINVVDSDENNVSTMKIWLYQTLHLIMDTNTSNAVTDPLKNNTKYTIKIGTSNDDRAEDRFGWYLNDVYNGISFTTIPDEGWYQATTERIEGLTDGIAARLLSKDTTSNYNKYALLTDQLDSPNVKVEFSFRMKGDFGNSFSLILKDAKKVDWDKVYSGDTAYTITDGTNDWERVEGYYKDLEGKVYKQVWEDSVQYLNVYEEVNSTSVVKKYKWLDWARVDSENNRYVSYWNNVGEYIKKYAQDGTYLTTYYREEGYYENEETHAKYRYNAGDYRNIDNYDDILDWSTGTYTWKDSYFVDADGNEIAGFDYWSLTDLASGYDDNTTTEEERTQFTFLWGADDVITESTELKWINEFYRVVGSTAAEYSSSDSQTVQYYDWSWTTTATIGADDYSDNNNSWDSRIAQLSLDAGQYVSYETNNADNWMDWNSANVPFAYKEIWHKAVFKVVNGTMTLDIVNDQGTTVNIVTKDSINTALQNASNKYRVDFKTNDSKDIMFDNFKVIELDDTGAEVRTLLDDEFTEGVLDSNVTKTYEYAN